MAQWATVDAPVLAASARLLSSQEHASDAQVLADLGWSPDRGLAVRKSMKLLIDSDCLVGKVLIGDGTVQDVTVTSVTEKGLKQLGQWRDVPPLGRP